MQSLTNCDTQIITHITSPLFCSTYLRNQTRCSLSFSFPIYICCCHLLIFFLLMASMMVFHLLIRWFSICIYAPVSSAQVFSISFPIYICSCHLLIFIIFLPSIVSIMMFILIRWSLYMFMHPCQLFCLPPVLYGKVWLKRVKVFIYVPTNSPTPPPPPPPPPPPRGKAVLIVTLRLFFTEQW